MTTHPRPPSLNLELANIENRDPTDSDSSPSSPDRDRDDGAGAEYFMVDENDARLPTYPVVRNTRYTMPVDEGLLHRVTPISKLPPELLIAIFSKLTPTADLRNCMLVSYHWALYCVGILWHRPLCNRWSNLESVASTLAAHRATFPYNEMVKRLNLSAVADKVNNGTVQAFMNCKSIERLTLTSCSTLLDFGVAGLVDGCKRLQALDVTNLYNLTDETILAVARNCAKLQGLNITNCSNVTDESLVAIAENCKQLKRLKLNGVIKLTDESITTVARHCRSILEIDLAGCQGITSESVTALLSNLPYLRELRLAHCPEVADAAFTDLSPKLHFDALRLLDLTQCEKVGDDAIARIIPAAPKLRNLVLSKCRHITDRAVESICKLTKNLHYIHLGHCTNLTDAAVINLVKHCNRIRYIDLACCSHLTDASVRHLALLPKLRRIGLVKCQNLTDASIDALAHGPLNFTSSGKIVVPNQFVSLERVHLSYCVNLTLKAFLRDDLTRFCRQAPPEFTHPQRDVFCVFSGDGVTRLRGYLTRLAEREHPNAVEESLLDPEDSPGADTMSDDGTIDGNDHGADIVYEPGRHGFHSISGARRIRPRSMQNLSGQHVEMPFFDHDQMFRAGSWTSGVHLSANMHHPFHPMQLHMTTSGQLPEMENDTRWQLGLDGEPNLQGYDEVRSRGQTRRHTLQSSTVFSTPSSTAFHPYTSRPIDPQDVADDADLMWSPDGTFELSSSSRLPQPSMRPTTFQHGSGPPVESEDNTFDVDHDAIMSTIPSGFGSIQTSGRVESPLASRGSGRSRLNNITGGMRALSASPLTHAEFVSRSGRSNHSREGSRPRTIAHREAIYRARRAAEVGDQRTNELPPLLLNGGAPVPLLPRELTEQIPSSPATSPSSTRVPTPMQPLQSHEEENQDVNMTS